MEIEKYLLNIFFKYLIFFCSVKMCLRFTGPIYNGLHPRYWIKNEERDAIGNMRDFVNTMLLKRLNKTQSKTVLKVFVTDDFSQRPEIVKSFVVPEIAGIIV